MSGGQSLLERNSISTTAFGNHEWPRQGDPPGSARGYEFDKWAASAVDNTQVTPGRGTEGLQAS